MKRFVVLLAVTATVVSGALAYAGISASPASAASTAYLGNVWVIYQNAPWNCPAGGSVVGIYAAVGDTWSTGGGGDWGDNIVYPRVWIGRYNTISAQVYCSRPWWRGGGYWGVASQHTFYASFGGQNFWF
jgi:hypothetical protein